MSLATRVVHSSIVYVSNEYHSNAKNLAVSAPEWDRNRCEIYGSALLCNPISFYTCAKPWAFGSVYIKVTRMELFQVRYSIFYCRIYQKKVHSDGCLSCFIICTMYRVLNLYSQL